MVISETAHQARPLCGFTHLSDVSRSLLLCQPERLHKGNADLLFIKLAELFKIRQWHLQNTLRDHVCVLFYILLYMHLSFFWVGGDINHEEGKRTEVVNLLHIINWFATYFPFRFPWQSWNCGHAYRTLKTPSFHVNISIPIYFYDNKMLVNKCTH